jgi:hypothetical protein
MKAKSAIHGARAAADTKEAAKTAANSRSTPASKQASAHAANVVGNIALKTILKGARRWSAISCGKYVSSKVTFRKLALFPVN